MSVLSKKFIPNLDTSIHMIWDWIQIVLSMYENGMNEARKLGMSEINEAGNVLVMY